jgi:molecular chaperone GrpE
MEPADTPAEPNFDQEKIAQLEKQVNDYKLLLADYENARKRASQEADRQKKYAAESLARDILGVIDNLERAVDAAQQAGEKSTLSEGVQATVGLFLDTLKRHGVAVIESALGTDFDPNLHMAVSQFPTNDYQPGQITQVLQRGFLLHDRILRPATVVVACEPPAGSPVE